MEEKGNVLFNDALLYDIRHMVKTIKTVREETHCCHNMGYSFQLAA